FYADTNGVRTHYKQVMSTLASAFAGHKGVIGYDVLNEPFSDPAETELTSLYADASDAIRPYDPNALLFLEPNLITDTCKPTSVAPPSRGLSPVYAPHFYHPAVMVYKNYSSPFSFQALTNIAYKAMEANAALWNAPLFVGEFGALADAVGVDDY